MKILAFGEVLWDIMEEQLHLGGAPLNFCGHNVQLGNKAYIISSVGKKQLGSDTLQAVSNLGIQTKLITKIDYPTGTVLVTLDNGIPEYEIKPGAAWDHISIDNESLKFIRNNKWDVFYFGTLSQREVANKMLLHQIIKSINVETKIFFDINLRQNYYTKDIITSSFDIADIVKINDEELASIKELLNKNDTCSKPFTDYLMDEFKIELLCITLGAEGAILYNKDQEYHFKPEKINVVSTVGAGDSFSAALIHRYISTGSIKSAGEFATKIAGYVIGFNEAIPKYSREFVKSLF